MMSGVYAQLSMSLDGFVAGPNDHPGNGLGDGGERLLQDVELEVAEVVHATRYRRAPLV